MKTFKTVKFEQSWLVLCLDRDVQDNIRVRVMGKFPEQARAMDEAATFRYIMRRSLKRLEEMQEKLEAVR